MLENKAKIMRLNIYRVETPSLSKIAKWKELKGKICSEGYNDVRKVKKEFHRKGFVAQIYVQRKKKETTSWLHDIMNIFDGEDFVEESFQNHNAIIMIGTPKSLYLIPQGRSHWFVATLSDLQFGLDFAERSIQPSEINVKGISYVERNKLRGVLNYKANQTDFPQASEAYFNIEGKPQNTIFGKNLKCNISVHLTKDYKFETQKDFDDFINIFKEIDKQILSQPNQEFPRFKLLPLHDKLNQELDEYLLRVLKGKKNEECDISLNRIVTLGDNIEFVGDSTIDISILKNKKSTTKQVDYNLNSIREFIVANLEKIDQLKSIRINFLSEERKTINLKNLIYAEIDYKGERYFLDSGRWSTFNESFKSLLDIQLREIEGLVLRLPQQHNFSSKCFHMDENKFISEIISTMTKYEQFHKKNVYYNGVAVEIGDLFDKDSGELIAVKMGFNTSKSIYSFEQSILSMQVLRDRINKRRNAEYLIKKYSLDKTLVYSAIDSKKTSVLWIVDKSNKSIYESVKNNSFSFLQIRSILLRLKILSWYNYARENGFEPILYMGINH